MAGIPVRALSTPSKGASMLSVGQLRRQAIDSPRYKDRADAIRQLRAAGVDVGPIRRAERRRRKALEAARG